MIYYNLLATKFCKYKSEGKTHLLPFSYEDEKNIFFLDCPDNLYSVENTNIESCLIVHMGREAKVDECKVYDFNSLGNELSINESTKNSKLCKRLLKVIEFEHQSGYDFYWDSNIILISDKKLARYIKHTEDLLNNPHKTVVREK